MKLYYNIFLFILLIRIVSAIPPVTTVQNFPEGYVIIESEKDYIKLNTPYTYNFFVYNSTNGILMNNDTIYCTFYLANRTGHILFVQNTTYNSGYWYVKISSSNFTTNGVYPYGVSCHDTQGGAISGLLEVTTNGKEPPSGIVIVIFTLVFILIFYFGLFYFFRALEKFATLEMDFQDTIILIGTYLSMWIFYYFCLEYLGNSFVNEILEITITIGALTHVFLPLVGFMVAFIMATLKFKQKARITY